MVMQKVARELWRPVRQLCRAMTNRRGGAPGEPAALAQVEAAERQAANQAFFSELTAKTNNFGRMTWLGNPIWQNVLDLWTIQETIAEVRPSLLIETGTNRGGSSLFFAHLMDLLGQG